MAAGKEIRGKIKSVENTKKITKAMELVAASKMKRAINATLASRPYTGYSWEVLQSLSQMKTDISHPLLEMRPKQNLLVVLITSNRGLCGAYNAQIMREVIKFIKLEEKAGRKISFITVGKKGEAMLKRLGQTIVASFSEIPDNVSLRDIIPIANLVMESFKNKEVDRVYLAHTDFVSALTQKPHIRRLLPISLKAMEEIEHGHMANRKDEIKEDKFGSSTTKSEYLFEPGYDVLMPILVEKLAKMQIFQMLLESLASEQSSRMVAMKNASEAAGEMIEDLTLVFNKARQSAITQEISEISAGMASVT